MMRAVVSLALVGCAGSASPEGVCPIGQRPLFFVGNPDECAVVRFDCPTGTMLVQDLDCGCGCTPVER